MGLSLLVLCWAAGCDDDVASSESLDGRTFLLDSSEGFEAVQGTTVRLRFQDGSLSLQAGCNTNSGDYAVRDGVLIFENISSTQIGCDPARHEQDEQLVKFLTSKPRLKLDGEQLTLSHADDSIRKYWVEHGRACRRIGAAMGQALAPPRQGFPNTQAATRTKRLRR